MAHGVHRGELGGLEDDRRTDEEKMEKKRLQETCRMINMRNNSKRCSSKVLKSYFDVL
jgi:hypothetical protein